MGKSKQLSNNEVDLLLEKLESRFYKNGHRHNSIQWSQVKDLLLNNSEKLWSINEMERTGGEPDVVKFANTKGIVFCDCSTESPKERRSLCYDRDALNSRKKFKPSDSAVDVASKMAIELLNEDQYRKLQEYGEFDTKTSSWLHTPNEIRKLGGAIIGDRRFGRVFIYHNGAESYYAGRGFRGLVRLQD